MQVCFQFVFFFFLQYFNVLMLIEFFCVSKPLPFENTLKRVYCLEFLFFFRKN